MSLYGKATPGGNLVMPFPLRDDYSAQLVIPVDMTADEAERLCKFIKSLAVPDEEIRAAIKGTP